MLFQGSTTHLEWLRAHTSGLDPDSIGNELADWHAKNAHRHSPVPSLSDITYNDELVLFYHRPRRFPVGRPTYVPKEPCLADGDLRSVLKKDFSTLLLE